MRHALLAVVLAVCGCGALLGCGPHDEPINLGRLRGTAIGGHAVGGPVVDSRVLVLNVFGSWCAPCIAEADGFGAAYDKFRSRGVVDRLSGTVEYTTLDSAIVKALR